MKIYILIILSLFGSVLLYAQPRTDTDSFIIKKADSAVLQTVKLGFAVPDIPAFKALGLDPSNILRPSEAKDIALMFGSFRSDGDFIVPKNLAVEITPGLLINPWFTLQQYQKNGLLRTFTKTRVSFGTNEDKKTGINNVAFGLRTTLIDKADFRLDNKLLSEVLLPLQTSFTKLAFESLVKVKDNMGKDSLKRLAQKPGAREALDAEIKMFVHENGIDSTDARFKDACEQELNTRIGDWGQTVFENLSDKQEDAVLDSINKVSQVAIPLDKEYNNAIEAFKKEKWNAARLDFAYSLVLQSPDSLLGHVKFNRHLFWLAYATRPGKNNHWAQLLFSINNGVYSANGDLHNEFTGNFRFYAGKNRVKGFFESQYQNLSRPSVERIETLFFQIGAEVNFFKGVWLHFGTGILNALQGNRGSQLLSNLNLALTIPEDFKLF